MSFTTPCFIRINTPELCKKLEELGYTLSTLLHRETLMTTRDMFFSISKNISDKIDAIDCGTNSDLFLAIAAINTETDYMQWFTDGKEWIFCDREDWVDMYSVLCCGKGHDYQYVLDKYHKATVEELIEHFKNKKP